MIKNIPAKDPGSFRDPSGFVYSENGVLYRQVNKNFQKHFDKFISSGCYAALVKKNLLISHEIIENKNLPDNAYQLIQPERVEMISYPYEWSFDMLRDAAFLTLNIARESMVHGMMLKDASPYNIQWHQDRLLFIDTLSFEIYDETKPWIAYRQFCEHFLAPLLLMHYGKAQMQSLMLAWPDGIPLAIVSEMLPRRSKFSMHTYLHIHLNARIKKNKQEGKQVSFSNKKLVNIFQSLEMLIRNLKTPPSNTTWANYYEEAFERDNYISEKKKLVSQFMEEAKPATIADLGANEGEFSKLAAEKQKKLIAADLDPSAINSLYLQTKKGLQGIQPMVIDLANPSPAIGVNNKERPSFTQRLKVDLIMALALVHHLAIGRNIPLPLIAQIFASFDCKTLIIEFVPKTDEKVQLMLTNREDIFDDYTQSAFEHAFAEYFTLIRSSPVGESGRLLYLFQRNADNS